MPSASTTSADVSSTATESSLLLRARPVSVAQKNSKLMVGGWGGGRRGRESKRGIVPWIGARQLHRRGESIGIGGYGLGSRAGGRLRRGRRPAGGDGAQVLGQLAAVGVAHLRPLLERQRDRVGQRLGQAGPQAADVGGRV